MLWVVPARLSGSRSRTQESHVEEAMAARLFRNNEGTADRTVRVLLGIVLLSLTFVGPRTPWGLIGLVPLLTGIFGICPLYSLFGISTCPMRKAP
jgi:hypothetical protein